MPIVRTYACPACNLMVEVTLDSSQWDTGPPQCPECQRRAMQQEFKPVALGGSTSVRARDIAYDIAANDYHVADLQREPRQEGTPKVRYKDQGGSTNSQWSVKQSDLEAAIAMGRRNRVQFGSGLDILHANLKSGAEPDLIENSKRRMIKVW